MPLAAVPATPTIVPIVPNIMPLFLFRRKITNFLPVSLGRLGTFFGTFGHFLMQKQLFSHKPPRRDDFLLPLQRHLKPET